MSTSKIPRITKRINADNANSVTYLHKDKCTVAQRNDEYRYLFDNTSDAIRVVNRDFTIRRINQAFADMTGVAQNDIAGRKCWEVFPSPLCHTSSCRLQRILDGEQSVQVEIVRMKKVGAIIPCIVMAAPLLDENENTTGIIEQFRDISERRRLEEKNEESEALYRALLEASTEAGEAIIILQDAGKKEGVYVYVNEQWSRITGYSKEELIGHCFFDLLSPEDYAPSISRYRYKIAGGDVLGLYEIHIVRKNGEVIPIELTDAHTRYQGKAATILYIRDVTERKAMLNAILTEKEKYRSIFEKDRKSVV
jgi:PAS domain S-box-containing protein